MAPLSSSSFGRPVMFPCLRRLILGVLAVDVIVHLGFLNPRVFSHVGDDNTVGADMVHASQLVHFRLQFSCPLICFASLFLFAGASLHGRLRIRRLISSTAALFCHEYYSFVELSFFGH